MPADTELLQRFVRRDDQEAFRELVSRQVNLVYSAAVRQVGGDKHLAEDVTQAVLLNLARSAARLLDRPSLAGWLYTTTRFLSAKAIRSHRRWRQREQQAQTMTTTESADPDWNQLRPVLDAAMCQLNAADREAVLARFFEGVPFAAVGERFGLSENSARMRVERALERLRIHLQKKGVSSTTAALALALTSQAVTAAPAGLAAAASTAALTGLGAGGAAGLLHTFLSMSSTKITLGVISLLGLVAAGSATYETITARRAVSSLAEVRQADAVRISDLQSQVKSLQRRLGIFAQEAAAGGPADSATPGSSSAGAAAAANPGPSRTKSHLAAALEMMDSPIASIPARMQLESAFAPLFKSLNLSADQVDQVKNLLFEKRTAALDAIAAAQTQGMDPTSDPKNVFLAIVAAQKDANLHLASILGPNGMSQYQQYTQDLPATNAVSRLQQTLSYTADPLTDAQASQLSQVLKQYSSQALPEPVALLNADLGVTTLNAPGLAQSQTFLTAPQLKALQNQIDQQHQLLIAREQMH